MAINSENFLQFISCPWFLFWDSYFFFFLLGELFFSFNLLALFVMNFSRKFLFEHTIKFNFGVCVCVCLCRHARCLQRSEEVPRTKVLDNCEIPCGSWELNPGLLEEQPVRRANSSMLSSGLHKHAEAYAHTPLVIN